jgi:hypothetical protein
MARLLLMVGIVTCSVSQCVLPPPRPEPVDPNDTLAVEQAELQPTTAAVVTLFRSNPDIPQTFDLGPAIQTLEPTPNVFWYVNFNFDAPKQFGIGNSISISGCTPQITDFPNLEDKDTIIVEAIVTYGSVVFNPNAETGTDPRTTLGGEPTQSIIWSAKIDGELQDCQ